MSTDSPALGQLADKIRKSSLQHKMLVQNQQMKWHENNIKHKKFFPRYWKLIYDSRYK